MGFYLKKRLHKNYFIQTRTSILYSQIQFLIIINLDILCIDKQIANHHISKKIKKYQRK